ASRSRCARTRFSSVVREEVSARTRSAGTPAVPIRYAAMASLSAGGSASPLPPEGIRSGSMPRASRRSRSRTARSRRGRRGGGAAPLAQRGAEDDDPGGLAVRREQLVGDRGAQEDQEAEAQVHREGPSEQSRRRSQRTAAPGQGRRAPRGDQQRDPAQA